MNMPWEQYIPVLRPGIGHYQGSVKGGWRHGVGVQTWETGRRMGSVYAGEWKDDAAHGKGRMDVMPDQLVAEGGWKCSRLHGFGCKILLPDGSVFYGVFRDGMPHGPDCEWRRPSSLLFFKGRFARGRALHGLVENGKRPDADQAWEANGTDTTWDWTVLVGLEILATETEVAETLSAKEWVGRRTEELRGLWDTKQEMVLEFAKRYAYEPEEGEGLTSCSLGDLATCMWDHMPASHLFAQTRTLAIIHAKKRASVRKEAKMSHDDFMAHVMKADEQCSLVGKNSFHAKKTAAAIEALADRQHPQFSREILVGRVEEMEPDSVTHADLHLDITQPPCKPGDMEYVAKLPFGDTCKIMKTHNGERFSRKYVDRYCGHALREVKTRVDASVQNLLGNDDEEMSERMIRYRMHGGQSGKGCPKTVSGGASHDLSDICTHIPAFSGEGDFKPILLAGQRLNQVDYELDPKPVQKEGSEGLLPSERSFKLKFTPRPGAIDLVTGSFRVSPVRSPNNMKPCLSTSQNKLSFGAADRQASPIGFFQPDASSPQTRTPSSYTQKKMQQWESEGMMLPGYQRMIPEVR